MGDKLINFLNNIPPQFSGVLMAMFMAVLRVMYDKKETSFGRILLESLICGGLSLTATYGISALGLNTNWAIFSGGVIGYLGSTSIHEFIVKGLNRKIDKG